MEKIIIKGDVYTVATKTECVVTSAGGTELGTATAGAPYTFTATTDRVVLSDPDAEFTRVNPKYAPVKLRLLGLLGGGVSSALPAGYLAAEFLEFGGKDKYVEVTTPWTPAGARVEVKAYERFYRVDVTSDEIGNGSHSNYFFWGVKNSSGPKWYVGCGTYGITSFAADTNWHNMRLVYAADGGCWVDSLKVRGCDFNANRQILRNFRLGATAPTVNELFYPAYTWVKKCTLWVNGTKWRDVHAAIDPSGKPCFYDFIEKEAFFNGTSTALTVGMTLAQARKLGKLPAGGGELTVSLPWEAIDDVAVRAALDKAAENGWTIIEQYREPEPTTVTMAVDFLESTGTQYIKIPYVTTADTVAAGAVQFVEFYDTNSVKYAMGTTNYPLGMGWGVFDTKATSWGWYFSGKKSTGFNLDSAPDKTSVIHYNINTQGELWINGDKAKDISPQTKTDAVVTSIGLFGYVQTSGNVKAGEKERHFYCDIFEGNKKTVSLSAAVDANGVPCMFDKVSKQPFYKSGTGEFIVGFDTVEAARNIAKLPVVAEGTLTVSLPAEARNAESMVPTAIGIATSRGWTIFEQYREA